MCSANSDCSVIMLLWKNQRIEEMQMSAGNFNATKLFTIVCIQDDFALYLYLRTHQVSKNMIVIISNQIESCTAVEKLSLKKIDSIVRRRRSQSCSVTQTCDHDYINKNCAAKGISKPWIQVTLFCRVTRRMWYTLSILNQSHEWITSCCAMWSMIPIERHCNTGML